jgi:hypothetical protein
LQYNIGITPLPLPRKTLKNVEVQNLKPTVSVTVHTLKIRCYLLGAVELPIGTTNVRDVTPFKTQDKQDKHAVAFRGELMRLHGSGKGA